MISLPALALGTWLRIGAAVALSALVAWGLWKGWSLIEGRGYARAQAEFAIERERLATKALDDVRAAREEEQRRHAAQQEVIHVQAKELARARADRDAAAGSAERLRKRAAELAAACRAGAADPAPGATSTPAPTAGDLLADMLGRIDAATGGIAAYADEAAAAGAACEGYYDALRPHQ